MKLSDKKYKFDAVGFGEVTFRLLPAAEADQAYSIIKSSNDNPISIEYIFTEITESKYDIDTLPAGLPVIIVYACLKSSGYFREIIDIPLLIEESRSKIAANIFYKIYSKISKIFPQYKLSELKSLTITEMLELLAYTESVLGEQLFDTVKMKELAGQTNQTVTQRKGIAAITSDEIELLKGIIAREEAVSERLF